MSFPVRLTLSIVLFIAFVFVGFTYLLRGCLSKYDERSISPKVLYFEKENNKVIFAVLKFDKATSYRQSGGFTSKSVSTTYSVQNNDATSGEKLIEKEVREYSDIKNHPVEILGAAGYNAWVFMGEPMVFDPFTLKTIAAVKELEEKNPALKGKFPAERRYYRFDNVDHNLYLTAKDGSAWMIDGKTFKATQQESNENGTAAQIKQLEKLMKENMTLQDSLMEQKLRRPARQLAAKEISLASYRQLTEAFNKERNILYEKRDSLQQLKSSFEQNKRSAEELLRRMESLHNNFQFSQARLNSDTINGKWVGLYSEAEMDELYDRFDYRVAYDETARRQWFSSVYAPGRSGDIMILKDKVKPGTCLDRYLDGGFLVDNNTGKPVLLADGSRLIIYKNQIGNDGKIQLAKVNDMGVSKWSFDTGLTEWEDYILTAKQLFITAKNNSELSGDDCNILLLINLDNGKAEMYDYFDQKKVTAKNNDK